MQVLRALLPLLITFGLAAEVSIQKIENTSKVISLDSTVSDSWYASYDPIDATAVSQAILAETDKTFWAPVRVPGLVHENPQLKEHYNLDFSKDTGKYWMAMLTLGDAETEKSKILWYKKVIAIKGRNLTNLALRLGKIGDRDRTYFNGKLIGKTGRFNATAPQGYDKIRIYEKPAHLVKPGKNVILVQTQNYFADEIGIIKDSTALGPADTIISDFYHTAYFQVILFICYLTTALYFIFLFIRRPEDLEYLAYAAMVIVIVLYQFLRTQLKYEVVDDFLLLKKIEYASLAFIFPFFTHFFRTYFVYRYNWFFRCIDIFFLLFSLLFLLNSSLRVNDFILTTFLQPGLVFPLGTSIYILTRKSIGGDRDALLILLFSITIVISIVLDILSANNVLNLPTLTGYTFILFIMSLAGILANKFVRLHRENEKLNADLEAKVQKRTEELQATLHDVRLLKEQQDGDYFLTSLLLKPLGVNKGDSDLVNIDFYVRQKKQFKFKKWQAEIGGDLCIAHKVQLFGRTYTVFLNGDAMGKSIQGAGGALVLGVIFNSVVARTQVTKQARQRYPEQWLNDCFNDLQSIFVNFNGSMMVSIVMGMIDDQNGTMYYLNAEHPFTVLYRDDRASFIETDLQLHKIGVTEGQKSLQINLLPLKQGDIIIMGSDGRDDIDLENTAGEDRVINEDHELFLGLVEQAGGDLERIAREIAEMGKLTDDLSLLRIKYAGQAENLAPSYNSEADDLVKNKNFALALEKLEDPKTSDEMLLKLKALAGLKRYAEAARLAEEAIQKYNVIEDFTLLALEAYRGLRNFTKAADHGERLRLRNPSHIKNLVLLADIYRVTRNKERARNLIEKARKLQPANKNVIKLARALGV